MDPCILTLIGLPDHDLIHFPESESRAVEGDNDVDDLKGKIFGDLRRIPQADLHLVQKCP